MQTRLNQYRIMWVFVSFDLPTQTKRDRYRYGQFRKNLLKSGYTMLQYSVYIRHCNSRENAEVHKKRVKTFLPPNGKVILYHITDKQFGMIEFFNNKQAENAPDTPQQLELF